MTGFIKTLEYIDLPELLNFYLEKELITIQEYREILDYVSVWIKKADCVTKIYWNKLTNSSICKFRDLVYAKSGLDIYDGFNFKL